MSQIQILQRFACLELAHNNNNNNNHNNNNNNHCHNKKNNKTEIKIDKVKQFLSQEKEYKVKL